MEMRTPDQQPLPVRDTQSGSGVLNTLDRALVLVTKVLLCLSATALFAMLVIQIADVIGIKILSRPVPGGIEMVAFAAVLMIAFAMGYTQYTGGHVAVDFIVVMLPKRAKAIIDGVMRLIAAVLLALLAFYSFRYAGQMRAANQVSLTQNIPLYPFMYTMAVCFVVTLLVVIREMLKSFAKAVALWTR